MRERADCFQTVETEMRIVVCRYFGLKWERGLIVSRLCWGEMREKTAYFQVVELFTFWDEEREMRERADCSQDVFGVKSGRRLLISRL